MKIPRHRILSSFGATLLIGAFLVGTGVATDGNAANPCAARNPCAANPCAARNPCAVNPCAPKNPCAANPCAQAPRAELNDAEAAAAYQDIVGRLQEGYAKSSHPVVAAYINWKRYNRVPYTSDTHGGRFVNNFANDTAKTYGKFEKAGVMPVGSVLAKNSFAVTPQRKVEAGPLFLMEKMAAGFNHKDGNWSYTIIMPNGAIFGTSKGKNAAGVQFCADCHGGVADKQDSLFFLPEEYRLRQ